MYCSFVLYIGNIFVVSQLIFVEKYGSLSSAFILLSFDRVFFLSLTS